MWRCLMCAAMASFVLALLDLRGNPGMVFITGDTLRATTPRDYFHQLPFFVIVAAIAGLTGGVSRVQPLEGGLTAVFAAVESIRIDPVHDRRRDSDPDLIQRTLQLGGLGRRQFLWKCDRDDAEPVRVPRRATDVASDSCSGPDRDQLGGSVRRRQQLDSVTGGESIDEDDVGRRRPAVAGRCDVSPRHIEYVGEINQFADTGRRRSNGREGAAVHQSCGEEPDTQKSGHHLPEGGAFIESKQAVRLLRRIASRPAGRARFDEGGPDSPLRAALREKRRKHRFAGAALAGPGDRHRLSSVCGPLYPHYYLNTYNCVYTYPYGAGKARNVMWAPRPNESQHSLL